MQNPDQAYLLECFDYSPHDGSLAWKVRPSKHFKTTRGWNTFNAQQARKQTGCESKTKSGHTYLKVRINKRLHACHRVIWVILHGYIPDGMEVDHVDGNTLNNSSSNLRLVTSSGNKKNRKRSVGVKAPHHGIYWYDRLQAYVVQITSDGRTISLGTYRALDDAVRIRKEAERGLGFHQNHGRIEALS